MHAPSSGSRESQESEEGGGAVGYAERRRLLLGRDGRPQAARRRELSALTDAWLAELLCGATDDPRGIALVAVGSLGRGELSPGSDLDLLLLHDGRRDAAEVASRIWYPVWNSGMRLDHSVRTPEEARRLAGTDLAVLLGLLDSRPLAGDARLAGVLRSAVLADWRAAASRRLPDLRDSCYERAERHGEVAFALEPDLKSGRGGLRDVVALKAVAASWLADRPHGGLDIAGRRLLDVRDALHLCTGRNTDRLLLQEQDGVAQRLGRTDADDLLREVNDAGRAVAYAADVTWRRVGQLLLQVRSAGRGPRRLPVPGRSQGPQLRPLTAGLLEHEGEVVLGPGAHAGADPVLALRAAATAAREGLTLGPATVERLAAGAEPLPDPWPDAARDALVRLLGAGATAVPVWEALDQAGLVVRLIPEWALVRSLPQRNAVHRFTVDRHLVEAATEAASRARQVARPDLLLIAALLHDIGKGLPGDHSQEGARVAGTIARRMGLRGDDLATVIILVAQHLLLAETATRRDLDDPATVADVADAVGSVEVLELLHALTEADAAATGPAVWSTWRAGLVAELCRRTSAQLRGEPAPGPRPLPAEQRRLLAAAAGGLAVHLQPGSGGATVTVVAPDRRGLLGAVAGVLALHRLSVRSATVHTEGDQAVDVWSVVPEFGELPALDALREDVRKALDGNLDTGMLLARREASRAGAASRRRAVVAPPRVDVVVGASRSATVFEVRAEDRLGLLHALGTALSAAQVVVRVARVSTWGAEAVDVFYVVDEEGRPLFPDRADQVARQLEAAAAAGSFPRDPVPGKEPHPGRTESHRSA